MAAAVSSLVMLAVVAASCRLLHTQAFASGDGGEMAKPMLVPVAASTEAIKAAAAIDVLNCSGVRVTITTTLGSSSSPTAASPIWRAKPLTSSPCWFED
ncbi:unnamed protein product [Urochloa humidicola]